MGWVKLLSGLVSLSKVIMRYIGDQQLIKSGISRAVATQTKKSLDIVHRAKKARNSVDHDDTASVRNDPANRDR